MAAAISSTEARQTAGTQKGTRAGVFAFIVMVMAEKAGPVGRAALPAMKAR